MSRKQLEDRQRTLVAHLVGQGTLPDGFAQENLHAAKDVIANKQAWIQSKRAKTAQPPASRWQRLLTRLGHQLSFRKVKW